MATRHRNVEAYCSLMRTVMPKRCVAGSLGLLRGRGADEHSRVIRLVSFHDMHLSVPGGAGRGPCFPVRHPANSDGWIFLAEPPVPGLRSSFRGEHKSNASGQCQQPNQCN